MEDLVRDPTSEDGAKDAATLFMWTGFAAVLATCAYGLVQNLAFIVVLSVLAMIGYVVVGLSLTRRDVEPGGVLAGVALATLTFTMWLIGGEVPGLQLAPVSLALLPVLGVVLSYTAGAVLARALVVKHPSLTIDLDDRDRVGGLLLAATVVLVWSPFVLTWLRGPTMPSAAIVATTGFVAAYGAAAGQLARAARVPQHIVAGSVLALLGHAWYIFQFSGLAVPPTQRAAVQMLALAGMLLSAFPVAFGIVAIQQARSDDVAEAAAPSEDAASE